MANAGNHPENVNTLDHPSSVSSSVRGNWVEQAAQVAYGPSLGQLGSDNNAHSPVPTYSLPALALLGQPVPKIENAASPAQPEKVQRLEAKANSEIGERNTEYFRKLVNDHGILDLQTMKLTDKDLKSIDQLAQEQQIRGLWVNSDVDVSSVTNEGLIHLAQLKDLQLFQTNNTGVDDKWLAHINGLKNLQDVKVIGTGITNEGLAHLKNVSSLRKLSLVFTGVTDEGLTHLRGLVNLENLGLSTRGVTDKGLDNLKDLKNLKSLWLDKTDPGPLLAHLKDFHKLKGGPVEQSKATDLHYLKSLTGLEQLTLGSTNITNNGLASLTDMHKLHGLHLSRTTVTDEGLKPLHNLTNLQSLMLTGTNVTDEGLAHLKGLKNLGILWLDDTEITGTSLAQLGDLNKLSTLSLAGSKMTDNGLSQVTELKHLRTLYASRTRVTKKGIAELRASNNYLTVYN